MLKMKLEDGVDYFEEADYYDVDDYFDGLL
jgi:hypothetical protein